MDGSQDPSLSSSPRADSLGKSCDTVLFSKIKLMEKE